MQTFGEVATVYVDMSDVRAEVPRILYGTGMEDVNHEIYGGLDAQRLYDESFEETIPPQVFPHGPTGTGGKECGRQWTEETSGGGEAALDDTLAHWGRRSERLSPRGGTAAVANRGLNGWGVPCRAGRRMVGHFFVRGRVDSLEVALQSRDGTRTYATAAVATTPPSSRADVATTPPSSRDGGLETASPAGWSKVSFSLVPGATDPAGRFLIRASGAGTIWIDDVYLADEPTDVFGRMGCREDIAAALRAQGVTFLRWGGSMANSPDYLLRNMDGGRRPYEGFWFKNSSAGFGVREFVRLADLMGLPCAVSIHAYDATGDAVAFAEWLRGFDGFVCVQIGNEECAGFTPAGGEPTIADTRRYCAQIRRLVPAMRTVNPKLAFASAMMWMPDHMDLMEEAFRLTDGLVEYWDLHVRADNADAAQGARETIRSFREMIRRLNPETSMKAAIFEENSSIHDMRRALAHVGIMEAAREAGDFLLASCPANAFQPWNQNDNGWDQGQIFFTPDKVWLQPCGWAQQMAAANHRDLLVAGRTDDARITVSATCDREGRSVVLHLANSTGLARRLAFDFAGGAKHEILKATSLAAPALEADNPPDDPTRISPAEVTEQFRANPVLAPFSYTVVEFRCVRK